MVQLPRSQEHTHPDPNTSNAHTHNSFHLCPCVTTDKNIISFPYLLISTILISPQFLILCLHPYFYFFSPSYTVPGTQFNDKEICLSYTYPWDIMADITDMTSRRYISNRHSQYEPNITHILLTCFCVSDSPDTAKNKPTLRVNDYQVYAHSQVPNSCWTFQFSNCFFPFCYDF
jgi:hypothetical protein